MSAGPLNEFSESVLRAIANTPLSTDFTGPFESRKRLLMEFDETRLDAALEQLVARLYIREINEERAGAVVVNAYQATALGKNYLAKGHVAGATFGNISNSNIAIQSPNLIQAVNFSSLDDDLKTKIDELQVAINKKDKVTMKKVFGYILDKSVDVAIAVLSGRLLR